MSNVARRRFTNLPCDREEVFVSSLCVKNMAAGLLTQQLFSEILLMESHTQFSEQTRSRRQTASALVYLRYATNTNLKASSA